MSSDARVAIEGLQDAFLPDKAGDASALFQLDLAGENGGKWLLDVSDGECKVLEQSAPDSDVTIMMDADDFAALFAGRLDPVQAFMGGKIKISGNLGLVMQLLNWFERSS